MNIHRRNVIRLAGAAAAFPFLPHVARADTYPSRPVRILVGYAAGGGVDIAGRLIAQWLSERLNGQFVVENRTGASTNIATEAVVRSQPDGYTLLLANGANAINNSVFDKLSFQFIRDMRGVGSLMQVPYVMVVNPSLPVKSIPELIAYTKANPHKLAVGSGGAGSPDQAASEYFKMETSADLLDVPYRGLAPALTDLLGGQVHLVFGTVPSAIEYIKAGRLRPLAVTTAKRSNVLPDVPTLSEFVPGYEAGQWYGIAAPKATPDDIVATLNKEISASQDDPKMKDRMAALGGIPFRLTPAEFDKFIVAETEKWAKVIKFAGIKVK